MFEAIAVDDIAAACDVLRPVFDESGMTDGFVSLEVSPRLAHDTEGTVEEARRLVASVDRPEPHDQGFPPPPPACPPSRP